MFHSVKRVHIALESIMIIDHRLSVDCVISSDFPKIYHFAGHAALRHMYLVELAF